MLAGKSSTFGARGFASAAARYEAGFNPIPMDGVRRELEVLEMRMNTVTNV
jgi:hypothetical protein